MLEKSIPSKHLVHPFGIVIYVDPLSPETKLYFKIVLSLALIRSCLTFEVRARETSVSAKATAKFVIFEVDESVISAFKSFNTGAIFGIVYSYAISVIFTCIVCPDSALPYNMIESVISKLTKAPGPTSQPLVVPVEESAVTVAGPMYKVSVACLL